MSRRTYKWAKVIGTMSQTRRIMVPIMGIWLLHTIIYFNLFQAVSFQPWISKYSNDEFILYTPGCKIPNYNRSKSWFIKSLRVENKKATVFCGKRAVLTNKTTENEIKISIDDKIMKFYSQGFTYKCCYKFISHINPPKTEDIDISYSQCTPFKNGTIAYVKEEVLTVNCSLSNGHPIYDDAYIILKKLNETRPRQNTSHQKWNVLMIGMDTISRTRAYATMPNIVEFFNTNGWYDFRAYHKVSHSTFSNMMTLLTGYNTRDFPSPSPMLLWDKYKRSGYFTAYGEDDSVFPDTFKHKNSNAPTTDHYMRPYFLTGDKNSDYQPCIKKLSPGEHLLNYAFDFTQAYKENNFFGIFWINSHSHDLSENRTRIEEYLIDFLRKLNDSRVLENTVVMIFGDHGSRLEKSRFYVESYYDERLPMFFMWLPQPFQKKYRFEKASAFLNQWRLITPYDIYSGLLTILRLSDRSEIMTTPRGCPGCKSIFMDHSGDRTCSNVGLDEMWCSCHNMTPVTNIKQYGAANSIRTVVSKLKNYVKSINTTNCTTCRNLSLKTVLRVHWYEEGNKKYYVVAVRTFPSEVSYEGVVRMENDKFGVVDRIYPITRGDQSLGRCAYNFDERSDCVCVDLPNCDKKTNTRTLVPFKKG